VARSWARDEGATLDDAKRAAYAAFAAAYAAFAAASAVAAAYAPYAATTAAASAAPVSGHTLAQCADIVRRHYPRPPRLPSKGGK
jgi:hypothetical protein